MHRGGPDLIMTASSATRMPGQILAGLERPGRPGQPVAQGTYTVNLETAREHGPYTLMQKAVDIGRKLFTMAVAGNAGNQRGND